MFQEHSARRQQLLPERCRRFAPAVRAQSIWRNIWRTNTEGSPVVFCFLSGQPREEWHFADQFDRHGVRSAEPYERSLDRRTRCLRRLVRFGALYHAVYYFHLSGLLRPDGGISSAIQAA